MVDSHDDEWDLFTPADRPDSSRITPKSRASRPDGPAAPSGAEPGEDFDDPYRDGPGEPRRVERMAAEPPAGVEPMPAVETRGGGGDSLLQHPFAPWLAALAAVLVVAVLLIRSSSNDDGDATARRDRAGIEQDDGGGGSEAKKNDCPGYALGANLLGVPRVASQPGVHIWHDIEGFHLKLVPGAGSVDAITGVIRSQGVPVTLISPAAPNASMVDDTLQFSLDVGTPELIFKRSCRTTQVSFEVNAGGSPLPVESITVGAGSRPTANPVVLDQEAD